MASNFPKKFWNAVTINKEDQFYTLYLDDKAARSPGGNILQLHNTCLMEKIAQEWQSIHEYIDPNKMPLSRLAMTYMDKLQHDKENMKNWLWQGLDYLSTDLLLFPSDQEKLRQEEDAIWLPLIKKAEELLDCNFIQSDSLQVPEQNARIAQTIFDSVYSVDFLKISVILCLVQSTGSVILAYLALKQEISAQQIIEASQLQEQFQMRIWGEIDEQNACLQQQAFEIKQFMNWVFCCQE